MRRARWAASPSKSLPRLPDVSGIGHPQPPEVRSRKTASCWRADEDISTVLWPAIGAPLGAQASAEAIGAHAPLELLERPERRGGLRQQPALGVDERAQQRPRALEIEVLHIGARQGEQH